MEYQELSIGGAEEYLGKEVIERMLQRAREFDPCIMDKDGDNYLPPHLRLSTKTGTKEMLLRYSQAARSSSDMTE